MTNPPDTRPYCKSMAKLVRLKVRFVVLTIVDRTRPAARPPARVGPNHPCLTPLIPPTQHETQVDANFENAQVEQELIHDWCTSTYTHHVGTINFLADGSMVYGAGDGSHFQGLGALLIGVWLTSSCLHTLDWSSIRPT